MIRAVSAVVLTLALVIGGWLVWWDQFARSPVASKVLPARPAVVTERVDELARALEAADWVSPGLEGPVLYQVGFRACPDCIEFKAAAFEDLHAAGVDTRVILYAPKSGRYEAGDPEKATLAELARTSDWALYEAWHEFANPAGFYEMRGDPAPLSAADEAAILKGRETRDLVAEIMAAHGWGMEVPAMFWRDDAGRWRVYMSSHPRGMDHVRRAMGAATG